MVKSDALAIKVAQKFLTKLKEQGIKIESAYLFSSYAKGTEHKA